MSSSTLHVLRGDGCNPQKPHLGEYNEFFGKANLAFFMNKIYFQSMSTPLNKNTRLAGIAEAVLEAPCTR